MRFNAAAGIATAVAPQDPAKVYAGSQAVHQSTDKGQTWVEISPDLTLGRGAISTIAPSPVDPRVIWVGSDDGLIQITRRGGRIWTRVIPRGREGGQVVHIQASPTDAGTAVAFCRDADQPNATLRVPAKSNYGREWEQVAPGDLHSSVQDDGAVGGGLFDSDRQLIGSQHLLRGSAPCCWKRPSCSCSWPLLRAKGQHRIHPRRAAGRDVTRD